MEQTSPSKGSFLEPPSFEFVRSLKPMSRFCLDLDTMTFTFDQHWGPMIGLPPFASQSFENFLQRLPMGDQNHLKLFLGPVEQGYAKTLKRQVRVETGNGTIKWFEWCSSLAKTCETDR